jgi:tetratricopeptide (TPR) repeat protein
MSGLPSADHWRTAGLEASARGDLPRAADYLNRYLARAPHDTATHYTLAAIYVQSGRADYAVQLLDGLVRSQPQNPDAHFYRGCIFQQTGRTAEAAGDYHRTLQLNPMHSGALQALQAIGAGAPAVGASQPPGPYPGGPPPPGFYAPSQSTGFVTTTGSESDDLMSLVYWGVILVAGIGAAILLIAGLTMVAAGGSNPVGWLVLSGGALLCAAAIAGIVWMTRREIKTL